MTLNGHNALRKKQQGSVGLTRYSGYGSCKHHSDVLCFVKALEFHSELAI